MYVPAAAPHTVEQRILEASARIGEPGMVTGWAALRLAGASYFDGLARDKRTRLPVPVLVPHSTRISGAGLAVARTRGELPEPADKYGVPCAPADVALLHELLRCRDARWAGVMVDMALAAGVVDLQEMRSLVSQSSYDIASHAVERACPHCRSPKESEVLQVWEDELGFPRPLMNRQVRDLSGKLLAVVDLLEVAPGVYGEYDGAAHRSRARHRRDEARAEALRSVGLEGFVLVAGDSETV